MEINEIKRSKLESLFKKHYDAAWINTKLGVLEAVYVTDADPREITIVPDKHGYVLKQNKKLLEQDKHIGTTSETYFIQTEKFFIWTKDKELYSVVKNIK